jgi:hypothetical protein
MPYYFACIKKRCLSEKCIKAFFTFVICFDKSLINNPLLIMHKCILFGKHYFSLRQYDEFTKLKQDEESRREKLNAQIKGIQTKVRTMNRETDTEIIAYNELVEKQLNLYKEIDSAIITIEAKNKRFKHVQIPCKFEEFLEIYKELAKYKKQLDDEVDKLILDLNLCRKEDLLTFETNLCSRGLNFGKTINETSAKGNISSR